MTMAQMTELTNLEAELLKQLNENYGSAMGLRNRLNDFLWSAYGRDHGPWLPIVQAALSNLTDQGYVTVCYWEDEVYYEIALTEDEVEQILCLA